MADNINNNKDNMMDQDFDYTIVLDGSYKGPDVQSEVARIDEKAALDQLYKAYEAMILREPTIVDRDDAYPHSYEWRMGGKYGEGKRAVLEEAINLGKKIADTPAYEKYAEEIKNRKFAPESWD